jgi:hypothetical protein
MLSITAHASTPYFPSVFLLSLSGAEEGGRRRGSQARARLRAAGGARPASPHCCCIVVAFSFVKKCRDKEISALTVIELISLVPLYCHLTVVSDFVCCYGCSSRRMPKILL